MFESVYIESLDLVSKCLKALQHCAAFDSIAEGYLKLLRPLYMAHSSPEPSPSAKRARICKNGSGSTSERFKSNQAMLEHILDLVKGLYGGEASILTQDFFAVNRGNLSENYRFMYAPPTGGPGYQDLSPAGSRRQSQSSQFKPHQNHAYLSHNPNPLPASPASSSDVSMGNTPENHSPSPQKYPHRSREEYEAFFRRVT